MSRGAGEGSRRAGSRAESAVTDESRSAVVLAGGRSRRFGAEDKALAEVAGTPMVRRTVDRLTGVVDSVVVNCRAEQRPDFETTLSGTAAELVFALDPIEDAGPLVGLRTSLDVVPDPRAFVVACDVPPVDPSLVDVLYDEGGDSAVAVARHEERLQPAQAVYPVADAVAACDWALDRGRRDLGAVLERCPTVTVSAADVEGVSRSLTNVNTREQLRRVEQRLG